MIEVLLLDIEGTVCPIAFVHEVMFPYARARLREWVASHAGDPLLGEVAAEGGVDAHDGAAIVGVLSAWMDADRKITPLKAVQGRIWRRGFESGALVAPMYDDVRPAIEAWVTAGKRVAVYSSGSVEAQKLLFAHTSAGDLTPLVTAWFDTTTGPKREAASYETIASALGVPPAAVLFCSDIAAELDAAAAAGVASCHIVRDGAVVDPARPARSDLPLPLAPSAEGAREAKRALRERMRQVRADLAPSARAEASAAITRVLCASPAWRAARCVALYASLPEEVDTAALIAAARAEGRRVALPVVVGRGAPLELRDATDPNGAMSTSRFGVLEPAPGAAVVPLDAIDLFVVPALAFDRDRRRLGYGAGFYDRTLAGLAAHKVLVAFAAQEVLRVPSDAHDVAMDAVLTEHGFVEPTP